MSSNSTSVSPSLSNADFVQSNLGIIVALCAVGSVCLLILCFVAYIRYRKYTRKPREEKPNDCKDVAMVVKPSRSSDNNAHEDFPRNGLGNLSPAGKFGPIPSDRSYDPTRAAGITGNTTTGSNAYDAILPFVKSLRVYRLHSGGERRDRQEVVVREEKKLKGKRRKEAPLSKYPTVISLGRRTRQSSFVNVMTLEDIVPVPDRTVRQRQTQTVF